MQFRVRGNKLNCSRWNSETKKYEKVVSFNQWEDLPPTAREQFTDAELIEFNDWKEKQEQKLEQAHKAGFKLLGVAHLEKAAEHLEDASVRESLSVEQRQQVIDAASRMLAALGHTQKITFKDWLRSKLN